MREILQNSDFSLKVSFCDISGEQTTIKTFKLSYSTPLSRPIVAQFDGTNYSPNCTPVQDGVIIRFYKPQFNVGTITVRREYTIERECPQYGSKEITEIKELPITIVQSYSPQAPIPHPTPIACGTATHDLVLIDIVVIESIKGDRGDPGMPIDRSLQTEQRIEGQFWVGRDGSRKELRGRRIKLTVPISNTIPAYALATNLQLVDTLCAIEGFIVLDDGVKSIQQNINGGGMLKATLHYTSSGDITPNSLLFYFEGFDPGYQGRSLLVDAFVTYTK